MPNGTYGGVRGRKTKVGGKLLLRFPPTRLGNGNRFLCYLSFSASAHGKKVAAAFAAVLH